MKQVMFFVLIFAGNCFAGLPQPPQIGEVYSDIRVVPSRSTDYNPFAGISTVLNPDDVSLVIAQSIFQLEGNVSALTKPYFNDPKIQQYLLAGSELTLRSMNPRVYDAVTNTSAFSIKCKLRFNVLGEQELDHQARLARSIQDLSGNRRNPDLLVEVNSTDFNRFMDRIDNYTGAFINSRNRAVFASFSVSHVKNSTFNIPFVDVKSKLIESTKEQVLNLSKRLDAIMNPSNF